MASVAICTAVLKPNVTSVPTMSLSIVFGTPTIGQARFLVQLAGDAQRAVAADDDEAVEAEVGERRPDVGDAVGRVERAAPLGAEHGAAPRQRTAHRLDRQRHRPPLEHPVPGVEEPDELVAVGALALAHDGPDDGVQAGAVPASREDSDAHGCRLRGRDLAVLSIRPWDGTPADRCRGPGSSRSTPSTPGSWPRSCCSSSATAASSRCSAASSPPVRSTCSWGPSWPSSGTSASRCPRCARPRADSPQTATATATTVRERPAPTKRTTTGPSQRKRKR